MPFRSCDPSFGRKSRIEASRERGTTARLRHTTPEIRNTRSPESVNRDSWSNGRHQSSFPANGWFKSGQAMVQVTEQRGPSHKAAARLGSSGLSLCVPQENGARKVGVGIMIAHNPLHGSGRAALPHPALALGDDAHAAQGIGMTDDRQRQPAVDEAPHAIPKDAAVLTAPRQRAMPEPSHLETKDPQRGLVPGHAVIPNVPTYHRWQPFALVGDGFVHASLKFGFHLVQLRLQSLAYRLPQHRKPSIAPLLYAYMRLSRPAESHHRPLAEPSVRLSPHSAPITQTGRPYGPSVTRIQALLFPFT